jgi:hypothetical protein
MFLMFLNFWLSSFDFNRSGRPPDDWFIAKEALEEGMLFIFFKFPKTLPVDGAY